MKAKTKQVLATVLIVVAMAACGSDEPLTIPSDIDSTVEIDDWYLENMDEVNASEQNRALYEQRFDEIQEQECEDLGGTLTSDVCRMDG